MGDFDLGRYLERIGLAGELPDRPAERLAAVHRAHATSIPFENLDPHRGAPVSLEPRDLFEKLVVRRRGGYCFEQNLLLKAGFEALGFEVKPYLARVRAGAPPGAIRPRSHMVLGVQADGVRWHADVGFGRGTLIEPIPFGAGGDYRQHGWSFRAVEDGSELVLQSREDGRWLDLYGFVPEPAPLIDAVVSNWYTSTHPRSPFVTGLIVCAHRRDGSRLLLSDWSGLSLTEQRGGSKDATSPVTIDQVPGLLAERFGLFGFTAKDGRIVL